MIDYAGTRNQARARRAERADAVAFVRRLDWLLLATVAGLVGYGLWAIDGITRYSVEGDPGYFVARQGIAAAAGVAGMLVLMFVDPELYRRYRKVLYAGTTVLMVVVFALGEAARGSTRWIDVGPFVFQPSEFGKLFFVLALAGFVTDRARRLTRWRGVVSIVGLGLVPMLLVFVQPDIGTTLVYAAALAAILFVGGVRWPHLVVLGAIGATGIVCALWVLPSLGVEVLRPYQTARQTGFTNPDRDPAGLTYNVTQSMTAVGSGGLDGRGVAGATQTRYDYVPEHQTDFVFASFAEQRGFFGAAILLLLYLLVVWRGLRVITLARDHYCAIVAGGIVVAFLFQVFVNVGMTMGIAPVTGIPLPFVTVGGSSMVANLLAIGVLQSIHARGNQRRRIGR